MDNLKRALKKAKPGGDAVPVLDENGKIEGFCGIIGEFSIENPKSINPYDGLVKCLKAAEKEKTSP